MKLIRTRKLVNKKSKAQSLIEYALILAMVTVIAITALQFMGKNMAGTLQQSADTVKQGGTQVQEQACTSFGGKWDSKTFSCTVNTGSGSGSGEGGGEGGGEGEGEGT